jgi:hypothetical protein
MNAHQLPLRITWLASVAVVFAMPTWGYAQLSVLSRGNPEASWRSSQLSTLDIQLASQLKSAEGKSAALAEELKAQREWLEIWQPGKLTEEPLWPQKKLAKLLVEPALDPNKKAGELRARLLGKKARPTSRETDQLKKLLTEFPNDVGVRQLHLQWLDQLHYRKSYPDEIASSAQRLFTLVSALPQSPETQTALMFCAYRRARALAYRDLPDVLAEKPLDDPGRHAAELLGAYKLFKSLVPEVRPEFILIEVQMLRRDQWHGRALQMLEQHGTMIEKRWFLKKRRDILTALGWTAPAKEAAELYASAYPEAAEDEENVSP